MNAFNASHTRFRPQANAAATPNKTAEVVNVTPDMARAWIGNGGVNIRSLSRARVREYAAMMAAGKWHFDPMPLIFRPDGSLSNGQHRLHAVAESGLAQQFLVLRDWSGLEEYEGAKRGGYHYLMQAGYKSATQAHAICGYFYRTAGGLRPDTSDRRPKPYEMVEAAEAMGPFLESAAAIAHNNTLVSGRACGLAAYVYLRSGYDPEAIAEFFRESVQGGDGRGTATTGFFRACAKYTGRSQDAAQSVYRLATNGLMKHFSGEPCQILKPVLTVPRSYKLPDPMWSSSSWRENR